MGRSGEWRSSEFQREKDSGQGGIQGVEWEKVA